MDVVGNLKDWLQTARTDPQLVEVIISGLQGWYSGATTNSMCGCPAFIEQSALGWDAFLEGQLLVFWQKQQDEFWKRVRT